MFFTIGLTCLVFAPAVFADTTGTISSGQGYAWGGVLGWINFGCTNCNVQITSAGLTGYAWSDQYGWINLSPNGGGVTNNCLGQLGGNAWSSRLGWINFSGAVINSSGQFTGTAGSATAKSGSINFSCDNCNVKTDWRQCSQQTVTAVQSSGGGFGGAGGNAIKNSSSSSSSNLNIINQITGLFTGNNLSAPKINYPPIAVAVPEIPQKVFQNNWQVIPMTPEPNLSFVNNTTPVNIQDLAGKFPQIANTFKSLGMGNAIDAKKLANSTFILSTIADTLGFSFSW